MINETRFQFIHRRARQAGSNSMPAINVLDSFIGGGAQIGLAFNDEDRYEFQNYTSIARGHHAIKIGARLRGARIEDLSPFNFGASFTFGGVPSPQINALNLITLT